MGLWLSSERGVALDPAGLLHWWPDPVEGTDEVTGRRGIRRGFGALEAQPEVRLGYAAGWTELGPGITNQTFTLTFWMRPVDPVKEEFGAVLSQDSGLNDGWVVQQTISGGDIEWVSGFFGPPRSIVLGWETTTHRWQAVALQVTPTEVRLWIDGRAQSKGSWTAPVSAHPGPLCVGNSVLGRHPWNGDLRDLRIFGRRLAETEIQELAQLPRSPPRDRPPLTHLVPFTTVPLPTVKSGDYQLQHFTADHGLPNGGIQCLTQGRDGAVWLGFEGALVRFDGRRFQMVESGDPDFPLSPPDVCNLTEDSAGNLWLGLYHGLVRKDSDRWTAFTNLGSGRFVTRVLPQDDGTLWLATLRNQMPRGRHHLQHFDPRTGALLADVPLTGEIRDLRPAPDGIWVATDIPPALWLFDPQSHVLTPIVNLAGVGESLPEKNFPEAPVIRVAETAAARGIQVEAWQEANGPLQWAMVQLGTNGPVLHWYRSLPTDWSSGRMDPTTGGPEWVAAYQSLLRRNGSRWERVTLRESETLVEAIVANAEGGIWAAVRADGLWLIQPRLVKQVTFPGLLEEEQVPSITSLSNGRLLVGSRRNQMVEFDPFQREPPTVYPLPHSGAFVTGSPSGVLYSATAPALAYLSRQAGTNRTSYPVTPYETAGQTGNINQIHAARDGSLWIVTARGVLHLRGLPDPAPAPGMHLSGLEPGVVTRLFDNLPQDVALLGLAEAPDGAIWIGSQGHGLFCIREDAVEHHADPDLLAQPETSCVPLGFSDDGLLWLGSMNGLGVFRGGKFQWLRTTNGLPEPVVAAASEAAGHIWLAGQRGVHAVPRTQLDDVLAGRRTHVQALSLGVSDGLLSGCRLQYQPAMARSADGQLWLATPRGVFTFDPAEALRTLRPPPVTLDSLVADGRPISLAGGAARPVLAPGEGRVVEFNFSSLSHRSPERVTFHYQLHGPDGVMEAQTAQSHVVLTHLAPGRHSFTVQARSGNGLVSDPDARIQFEVQPYFYQRALFRVAVALGGLGVVACGMAIRVRRVQREAALAQELRVNAERQRIARDMHDDLGAGLVRLAWLTGEATQTGPPAERAAGARPEVVARELLRSLEETVWAVNPSKDRLDSAADYLESWVLAFFSETPVAVNLDLPAQVPETPVSSEWRHHLFLLVKEACTNVLKHSRATRVTFALRLVGAPPVLELTLSDNGTGFSTEPAAAPPVSGGNGLGNLRRRAAELGGTLRIHSDPGVGTTVRLEVPVPGVAGS